MDSSRTVLALRMSTLLMGIALLLGLWCAVQTTPAYADLTAGTLVTQDGESEATTAIPKQLDASMLSIIDLKPAEKTPSSTDLTVKMTDGSTALSSGTHYTYTPPTTAANSESGRTITLTGKDSYAGKLTVNYKITVEGEPGEGVTKLEASYVEVRYNTDGFSVSLSAAGRTVKNYLDIPKASTGLSGELVVQGKDAYASQAIKITYEIKQFTEIRKEMLTVTPTVDGKSVTIAVTDGTNPLAEGVDYTLGNLVPDGVSEDGWPLHIYVVGIDPHIGTVDYYCRIVKNDAGDYQVVKASYLPNCTIELAEKTFLEDGNVHKPSGVTVKSGSTVLVENEDYTVSYPEGTKDPGEYEVTITGKDEFQGVVKRSYKIVKQSTSLEIVLADSHTSFTYTGSSKQPTFSTTDSYSRVIYHKGQEDEKALALNTDYEIEISSSSPINVGEYTVTAVGKGDYADEGAAQATYKIERAELKVSSSSFSDYDGYDSDSSKYILYYYTGAAIEPTMSYLYATGVSGALTKDVDYEVEYLNNTDVAASTAADAPTAILKGKGNFTGEDYVKFTISPCPFTSSYITCTTNPVTYTGGELTPVPDSVTFTKSGVALKKDVDYAIGGYSSNINAGSGSISLQAMGGKVQDGSMTANFTISPKPINSGDISVSGVSVQSYTGSAITPALTIKDKTRNVTLAPYDSSKVYYLIGDSYYDSNYNVLTFDYKPEYADNTNPGTATVTITGTGNYSGTRTDYFTSAGTGTVPRVKATDAGDGQVVLEWGAIYKATKYKISEKMTDGKYKTLSDSWTSTKCRVTNLSTTRNHRFLVQAFVDGKWSSDSDKNLASIRPTGAKRPTLRGFSYGKSAIMLSWSSVPGADRYAIYRKIGGRFQALTTSYTSTVATINKLKKKGKYTVYIRAYVDGKWSKNSNKVTVSPADPNPPVVKAVGGVGKGKVKLTWDKPLNGKKYMVEVQLANGKWKTLTKNCKKLTYTVKGLSPLREHTFRVRAYGNKKWSKTYSDYYVSATPDNA